MTGFVRVLLFVIAAETAVIAVAAVGRANRERPPLPDLARLDATTRAEVLDLRSRVQPDDAVSWQDLGDVYLAFGYFAEAETCFSRAAAIGPQTHDLLLRWGVCLDRLGRLPQAIAKFEQAAEQAGDERRRSVCQYHVARCYLRDERHEEALAALKRAGDFELALYELAKLRYRLGEFEAAASVLDRLLARLPDELKLLQLRARAAAALGDTAGAYRLREQFERAKDRLFVDSTVEYIGQLRIRHGLPRERARGLKLAESGKPSPAAEALAAAQQVEWDLSTARQLVRLYFGLGRFDDATRIVQQMIDRFGESPESLEQLADAAYLQERPEKAAELWQQAADLRPSARLHQLLAEYWTQAGNEDKAGSHRAASELHLGIERYRSNSLTDAVAHLSRATELRPEDAAGWYYLGVAQQASGDVEAARDAYRRCLALQPHHGRALDAVDQLAQSPGSSEP